MLFTNLKLFLQYFLQKRTISNFEFKVFIKEESAILYCDWDLDIVNFIQ